jgi:CMP-N,N'-diacetyllegionaminic acid synthase
MINGKKVIAIIPARGGSKGLPRKNILKFGGHPLIAWPIEFAKRSNFVDKIITSTDDLEIAEVSKRYGAEVPFIRSKKISGDLTSTEDTLRYSLLKCEEIFKEEFDYCVFLTCTDLFRIEFWLDEALTMISSDNKLESVFAVNSTHKNYWHEKNNEFKRILPWMSIYASRQVRKPIFREDTGLCCISKTSLIRQGKRIGDRVSFIIDDRSETGIDIHEAFDLNIANNALEYLMKYHPERVPPIPKEI